MKSVTIEIDKDYTVTLKDGFELYLAEITSKAEYEKIEHIDWYYDGCGGSRVM